MAAGGASFLSRHQRPPLPQLLPLLLLAGIAATAPASPLWSVTDISGSSSIHLVAIPPDDSYVAYGTSNGGVTALDLGNGATAWEFLTTGSGGSVDERGCASLSMLFAGGDNDRFLYALSNVDGTVLFDRDVTPTHYDAVCVPPAPGGDNVLVVALSNDLHGLSATTGATIWTHPGHLDPLKGFFRSSVDPRVVFVADLDDRFTAVNSTTGAELWSVPGANDWTETSRPVFSPDETVLYVCHDNKPSYQVATLSALRVSDGAELWSYIPYVNAVQGLAVSADGSTLLVFTSEPRIIALNTVDGTARWTADEFPASTSFDFRGAFVDPPPVVDARSERVYFAESYPVRMRGYSTNNGQVLIDLDSSFSEYLFSSDLNTIAFRTGTTVFAVSTDCLDGDSDGVCDDSDSCPTTALNDADGDGICGDVDSCPGDRANGAGAGGVCGKAPNGTLWQYVENSPSDSVLTLVASAPGRVYVGTRLGAVHAVDAGGSVAWTHFTGRDIEMRGVAQGDSVYVASTDYNVYSLTAGGNQNWRAYAGAYNPIRPLLVSPDGSVVIVDVDDYLCGYNGTNGSKLWQHTDRFDMDTPPAWSPWQPGQAFVALVDGYLVAINAGTGAVLTKFTNDVYTSSLYNRLRVTFSADGKTMFVVSTEYISSYHHDVVRFRAINVTAGGNTSLWEYTTLSPYTYYWNYDVKVVQSADDSLLYVLMPQPRIIALNATTGHPVWTSDSFEYSTGFDFDGAVPVIDALHGRIYVAEAYPKRLFGYSPTDGTLQVIVSDDFDDYIPSSDRETAILKLDDTVFALPFDCVDGDDDDGDGICNAADSCPNTAQNDADGDGVCDDADACPADRSKHAVDADCGELAEAVWQYVESTKADTLTCLLAVTDDTAYVGTRLGKVKALNFSGVSRGGTPHTKWTQPTGNEIVQRGAVSAGTLFVTSEDANLYAFATDEPDGALRWRSFLNEFDAAAPLVSADGQLVVVGVDKVLRAFNTSTGAVLWEHFAELDETKGMFWSKTHPSHTLYVGSLDDMFTAINARTGATVWNYSHADANTWTDHSLPVLAPDERTLYVGIDDSAAHVSTIRAVNATALLEDSSGTLDPTLWAFSFYSGYFGDVEGMLLSPDGTTLLVVTGEPRMTALGTSNGHVRWSTEDFPSSTGFDLSPSLGLPPLLDPTGSRFYIAEQYPRAVRGYSTRNGVLEISLEVDFDNFAITPLFNAVVFRHDDEVFAMDLDCTDGDIDSDGICDELDSCPDSALNDADGDGICHDYDSCPDDPANGGVFAATCGIADNRTLWHYLADDDDSFEVIVADTTGGFNMFVVGTKGGAVYGVNISAPAVAQAGGNALPTAWEEHTANGITEDGSLVGGMVYIVSDDYNIYALNATDGTLSWRTHTHAVPDDISASPDGSIVVVHVPYVYAYSDTYFAYNTSTGELLWEYTTSTWYYSSSRVGITWSKVYPGRFYCNHGDSFGAINGFNGTVAWTAAPRSYTDTTSSPMLSPDETVLYTLLPSYPTYTSITLMAREVHATAVGDTLWTYSFGSNYGVRGFTMSHDGTVLFVFFADPRMLAVDATTGEVMFSQQQFGLYTDFDFWLYNYHHGTHRPMLDGVGSRVYVGENNYPHHMVRGYSTLDGTTEISFDGQLASMSDKFSAYVVHNDSISFIAPSEAFSLELTCEGAGSGDADSDGICDDLDSCPYDFGNDPDGDGVCTAEDSCPTDFDDADSDGVCGELPAGTVWQYVENTATGDITVILAVTNDAVYVGTSSSKVRALTLGWNSSPSPAATNTADVLWTMATGRPAIAATLLPSPDGPAHGSVLYVTAEDYNMYAVNATSGATLWRTCGLTGQIDTPRASSDGAVLFAMVSSTLTAFDARNGTILWEHQDYGFYTGYDDNHAVVVMPTAGGDVVVVSSDYGQSAAAFDAAGLLLWELDVGLGYSYYYDDLFMVAAADKSKAGSHWPLPHTGDVVYFAEDNFPTYQHFTVSAVNVSNGSVAWTRMVDCTTLRHLTPPVSVDGDTLFAFCTEPAIFAIDAASGLMRWAAHDLDSSTEFDLWGTPARTLPSNGGAYVYIGEATEGHPRRYSTADGTLDTSFSAAMDATTLHLESFSLTPDGQVLIGMTADRVFAALTHENDTLFAPPVPRDMPPPADLIPIVPGSACSSDPRSAQVLFLENAYNEDAYRWVVEALGLSPVVVTNSEWAAMTTTDFHKYRAIVFGDGIGQSASAVQAAVENSAVWSAAIDGNIFVVGSDDASHPEAQGLIPRAMAYVVELDCRTGLYVSLARYYQGNWYYPVSVPLLQSIGDFAVVSAGCADSVHSVAYHDVVLNGLSDAHMSNWGCTAHEVFVDFPDSFTPLAIAQDISTTYPAAVKEYSDGSKGAPFMLISGEAIVLDCSPNTTLTCTGAGRSSCRYVYPELQLSQTEASLIGGDVVTVTGPCFDDNSEWLCMFGGSTVPVNVLSAVAGECTVPVANEPGDVIFAVLRDDGTFTSGLQTTLFTYRSPFAIGDVNITFDDGEMHELNMGFDQNNYVFFADGDVLTVEWDESADSLANFVALDIVLLEVVYTGSGYDTAVVAQLATATQNDGEHTVHVPVFTPVLDENYTGFSIVGVALLPPTTAPTRQLREHAATEKGEQAEGGRIWWQGHKRQTQQQHVRQRRSLAGITTGTHAGSASLLDSPLALFVERGQTCADWARADAKLHGTLPPPKSPGGEPVPCPQTNPTVGRWACAGIWDPDDRTDGRRCLSHATSGAQCCYDSIGLLIHSGPGVANLRMHNPAVNRFAAIAHDVMPKFLCKSRVFERYSTSRRSLASVAESASFRSRADLRDGGMRRLDVVGSESNSTTSRTSMSASTMSSTTSTMSHCVRWSTIPVSETLSSTPASSLTNSTPSSNITTSMSPATTSTCIQWSTASPGFSTSSSSASLSTTTNITSAATSSSSSISNVSSNFNSTLPSTSTASSSTSTSSSSTSTSSSSTSTSSSSTSTTSSSTSTTSSSTSTTSSSTLTVATSSYSTLTTSSHSTPGHSTMEPNDDESYDDRRPPNGGLPSVPTATVCPRTGGDAHFVSADGLSYTFNGIGQYCLVKHLAGHFEVAIELAPLGQGSVSNGAAVLDSVHNVVYEVHPGDGVSGIVLYVNSKPLLVPPSPDTVTHYKLGPDFTVNYGYTRVQLRWPNLGISGTFWYAELEDGRNYLQHDLSLEPDLQGQVTGMLGNFNGDPNDDLAPPAEGNASAVSILPNSSLSVIHYDFGMHWLLPATNALFRNGFNQSAIDNWTPAFENDFGDCPDGMEAQANALCGGVAECLYDAAATCDLFVANLTVEFEKAYIAQNITNDTAVVSTLPLTTTMLSSATTLTDATSTTPTTSTPSPETASTSWWVWLIVALVVIVVVTAVAVVVVCMNKDKQAVNDKTKQHWQASSAAPKQPPASGGDALDIEVGGKEAATDDSAALQGSTVAPPIPQSTADGASRTSAF